MKVLLATLAAALAFSAGVLVGDAQPVDIPLCQEDEVVTFDGRCAAPDDMAIDYVGGVGWVID